jgi:hypothetical protein
MYRQDVAARRIYAISQGFSSEKLFYDFSAGVNDTLFVFFMYPQYGPPSTTVIVAARDSIFINGTYRRRMEVISAHAGPIYPREYWIEGIGSSLSPVLPGFIDIEAGMADATGPRLLCVSVAGSPQYIFPGYTTCTVESTLAVNKLSAPQFEIFPNPSSGLLHFTGSRGTMITVYDALGNIELSLHYTDVMGVLDLTGRPGLHVVRVTGDGGVFSSRILIEDK